MLAARVRLALLATALGGALAAQARLPDRSVATAPIQRAPVRPELARAAALGFDALAGDYLWLRAVQIVGEAKYDPARHADEVAWLIETATVLDPFVDHPYRFAALWLSDRPETVERANRLLERGIAYHPADWRNRFYLAFNHFFYLGDSESAAIELERAVGLPGAPDYLGRLLARLHADAGGLEVAEAFLRELLQQTEDPYLRAGYEKALREIETERRARWLDRAQVAFRERHGRDIERVEDLLRVVEALPPEPNGGEWVLDEKTGRIVSSRLGRRYELHFHPADRERREAARRRAGEAS